MFISYQTVRNTFIATVLAGGAGLVYYVNRPALDEAIAESTPAIAQPLLSSQDKQPTSSPSANASKSEDAARIPTVDIVSTPAPVPVAKTESAKATTAQTKTQAKVEVLPNDASKTVTSLAVTSDEQLLQAAMRIANAPALKEGKDVLGMQSSWKLNLYDDDNDGVWDRGKLDTNRDDQDDEKWNFKQGRWEKDGGATVWDGSKWRSNASSNQVATSESVSTKSPSTIAKSNTTSVPSTPKSADSTPVDKNLTKYREAMRAANAPAAKGKGKDVLGPGNPWKLNLYDDDNDGRWDRGKLDYNRDDIDDEKWNFKNGRWEKDGGGQIWDGTDWKKP